VLNKPAGLVVHPAPGNPDGTLVNALIAHLRRQPVGHRRRAPARHRASLGQEHLGRDGGGKNDEAHQRLSKMFAAHDLTRIYQAVVWGTRRPSAGSSRRDRAAIRSTASAWRCARPAGGRR